MGPTVGCVWLVFYLAVSTPVMGVPVGPESDGPLARDKLSDIRTTAASWASIDKAFPEDGLHRALQTGGCPYTNDGECDEPCTSPAAAGVCGAGTDTADCSVASPSACSGGSGGVWVSACATQTDCAALVGANALASMCACGCESGYDWNEQFCDLNAGECRCERQIPWNWVFWIVVCLCCGGGGAVAKRPKVKMSEVKLGERTLARKIKVYGKASLQSSEIGKANAQEVVTITELKT